MLSRNCGTQFSLKPLPRGLWRQAMTIVALPNAIRRPSQPRTQNLGYLNEGWVACSPLQVGVLRYNFVADKRTDIEWLCHKAKLPTACSLIWRILEEPHPNRNFPEVLRRESKTGTGWRACCQMSPWSTVFPLRIRSKITCTSDYLPNVSSLESTSKLSEILQTLRG